MHYKDELLRIRNELNERKFDLEYEIRNLPPGELLITDPPDGYRRYMQRLPAKGNRKKNHCYGIKKKPDVLQGLVRKEYINGALKIIDSDIKTLETAIRNYKPADENTIMRAFKAEYPELTASMYGGEDFVREWKTRFKRIENVHPENLRHRAADGTKARSKNELYIASRLDHYGIVYRWDCPTGIPGLYYVPDYTIYRAYDERIIYWEHFAMMDLDDYKNGYEKKMWAYEKAGIVPWDNLIVTFDTLDGGLRGDLVEAMIKCWLL